MTISKTKLIREVNLSRSRLVKGNAQEIISVAEESMTEFKNCIRQLCKLLDERFLIFRQDVWYDSLTNLLLPKFDKNFCRLLTLDEFAAQIDGTHNDDLFLTFAGFKGRCISAEECREIFSGNANHYPHAPGNRRPRFFIDGKEITASCLYTQFSWTEKTFNSSAARSVFAVAAHKNYFCLETTGQLVENIGSAIRVCGSNPSKSAVLIPVCNLPLEDKFGDKKIAAACAILEAGLVPINSELGDVENLRKRYLQMKKYLSYDEDFRLDVEAWQTTAEHDEQIQENIATSALKKIFLECDMRRANLTPYPERFLTDSEAGHWELYEENFSPAEDSITIAIDENWYMKNPKFDVKASGVCAIDFGTKSTVAVCLDDGKKLLRIGRGELERAPSPNDYENPTVIELRDYVAFLEAYQLKDGRPFTEWEQLTVSHEALNRLLESEDRQVAQSIFGELKQWANRRQGLIRLRDRCGKDILLYPYDELSKGDFDPVELYAYYVGLYINSMYNGIYLEYIFSFPVNYKKNIREHLLESFRRGIKHSLPESILNDEALMKNFSVYAGASEPAAYAVCALRELEREKNIPRPTEREPIYFGVFDFGGGTTDFDFGIWRLPTAEDKRGFNDVIEHFAAESDSGLGGEKLLNLIAYEVYKNNLELMRENSIPFALPEGCKPFDGAEFLLSDSLSANLNRRRLSDKLRPIWEEWDDFESLDDEPLTVTLFTERGKKTLNLIILVEDLRNFLGKRILRGVENFFCALREAFINRPLRSYHILLAGNSCKSNLLQEIFRAEMERQRQIFSDEILRKTGHAPDAVEFILHMPLGQENISMNYERMPTGKSGVAFGLLDCRRGGNDVLIIDKNFSDETKFYFHLGTSDGQGNFKTLIPREDNDGTWKKFLYVTEDKFDIFFTDEPRAIGSKIPVDETERISCRINFLRNANEGQIYIRNTSPNEIEYVVAEIADTPKIFLSKVAKVEFND